MNKNCPNKEPDKNLQIELENIQKRFDEFWKKHEELTSDLLKNSLSENKMLEIILAESEFEMLEKAGIDAHILWNNAKKGEKFKPKRVKGAKSDSTKHIEELVKLNPNQSAKELERLADKEIIGDIQPSTFANKVSKAKKNN